MTKPPARSSDRGPWIWDDESAAKRRSLEHVESILDGVLARMGGGKAPAMVRISEEWGTLAGPAWADQSRPVALEGARLTVEVASGAVASRLKFESRRILGRLDQLVGAGVITDIVFKVGRPRRRSSSP